MADERRVSDTQPYVLGAAGTLILSVTIGERQVGGTALRLNGAIVPFPDQQASVRIPVGTPPSVLDCVTLVEDVNPASNRTSVIFTVAGGPAAREYSYALEASEKGRVRYDISLLLI